MMHRWLVIVMALCLTALAFAQPDPAGGPGGRNGGGMMGGRGGNFMNGAMNGAMNGLTADNTVFETNALGVFIIHNGVIAKFSGDLNPVGVKELFDPLPPQPKPADPQNITDAERKNLQEWIGLVRDREAPFSDLVKDDILHIVIGLHYFRVNLKTLAVDTKADLTPPADPNAPADANAPRAQAFAVRQAPMLKLVGNTLYVLDTQALFAVDTTNGKVNTVALPKEMFPMIDMAGMRNAFFGGNGGQGNGGGMRGNGGGMGGNGGGQGGNGGGMRGNGGGMGGNRGGGGGNRGGGGGNPGGGANNQNNQNNGQGA